MNDCIFCKIVAGELPKYQVYEDDMFLGFLDINPLSKGNSLLIPKKHHQWVYDVTEFGAYWEAAKKIAIATKSALNSDFISFLTIGTEVPHAHIRIIPRFNGDAHQNGLNLAHHEKYSSEEMAQISQQIKNLIK